MSAATVLLCRCATHKCLEDADVSCLHQALESLDDIDLRVIDDLCGLAEKDRAEQQDIADADHVIACFPRAVRWLLNRDHGDGSDKNYLNLRNHSAAEILLKLNQPLVDDGVDRTLEAPEPEDTSWLPWYPVIDYDRCTHCGQCLSFCLFDVFDTDEKNHVVVAAPRKCKDNCPACARICPEVAIMFPKSPSAPINGDEIQDELLEREKALVAMQQSGGANIYTLLNSRSRSPRKGLLKPDARRKITGSGE